MVSPRSKFVIEQQCSTTWSPLNTSPSASTRVFPCSTVISPAISFICFLIRSWYLNIIACLCNGVVLLQLLKAVLAALTAAFISSRVLHGTWVTISLVAGLWTSTHLVAAESTKFPSMTFWVLAGILLPAKLRYLAWHWRDLLRT